MRPSATFALQLILAMLTAFAVVPGVSAQTPAERERAENERELEIRIWNLRMLSDQSRKSRKKRQQNEQLALAQIQEDFTRLQIVSKSLGRAALGSGALDLRFVSKSASEIRKHAERLNDNLALPEPDASNKPPNSDPITSPEQIKPSILRLARLVFRFVDNPFFNEVSVVNTEQTTAARRDLEEIIERSEQLKRDSERFEKADRKKVP